MTGAEPMTSRRFVLVAALLPVATVLAAGPLMGAIARAAGTKVVDGAAEINPIGFGVLGPSLYAVIGLSALAFRRRLPIEQRRFAPWPMGAAVAVLAAAVIVGLMPADLDWKPGLLAVLVATGVGAVLGHRLASSMLGLMALPESNVPAPDDASRYMIAPMSTAVWVGRLPALSMWTWIRPTAVVLLGVLMLVGGSPIWIAGWVLLGIPGHAIARTNQRLVVLIGPSGVQLRAGVTRRVRLRVDLANIAAAAVTRQTRHGFFAGEWKTTAGRLAVVTSGIEGLLIVLTDGSEIAFSMVDPAEPVSVLNGLLDRRARVSDGRAPC